MGNGSSLSRSRIIHVDMSGRKEKILFSSHSSTTDIMELLTAAAGVSRYSTVRLKDESGAFVAISATMPGNTIETPYKLIVTEEVNQARTGASSDQVVRQVLNEINQQFTKAFRSDEQNAKLEQRISTLENLVQHEEMKLIEIERCKKDITDIKSQMFTATKKIDYNRIRPGHFSRSNIHSNFCSPLSDDKWKRDIPAYPKYTLSQETVDYLKHPTFDIWHWEPNEMLSLLEHMYHELGLVKEFGMNPIVLKRWLLCVQESYRNNPFHNFRHCFCVTQMMYGIIHMCQLWEKMSREDLGILLTACICHDLDHPGYNNTYQINARTDLAVRYNDISPLENHHCAVAFQIFSNPETNIFNNLDSSSFKRIRSGIIMLILATDMARHSEILDSFKAKLDDFDFTNEDHLNSMKMVMIKCCDISNEVRPFEVSEPWVDCLLEEYFNQSDREKEEGLPVAPFMDRDKVTKPTAQIGFIKFVLIPMFETIAKLFPKLDAVMVAPLKEARDRYEQMKASEDKPAEAKPKQQKQITA